MRQGLCGRAQAPLLKFCERAKLSGQHTHLHHQHHFIFCSFRHRSCQQLTLFPQSILPSYTRITQHGFHRSHLRGRPHAYALTITTGDSEPDREQQLTLRWQCSTAGSRAEATSSGTSLLLASALASNTHTPQQYDVIQLVRVEEAA